MCEMSFSLKERHVLEMVLRGRLFEGVWNHVIDVDLEIIQV